MWEVWTRCRWGRGSSRGWCCVCCLGVWRHGGTAVLRALGVGNGRQGSIEGKTCKQQHELMGQA